MTEQDVGSPRLGKVGSVFSALDTVATPRGLTLTGMWGPSLPCEGIGISLPLRCLAGLSL